MYVYICMYVYVYVYVYVCIYIYISIFFFILDDKEYTKGEVKILSVELAPDSMEVLGGNVTLYFYFDRNSSEFSTEKTLSVFVYDNNTDKKLHTENVQFRTEDRNVPVVLPCTVFDHPGLYRFKYRISKSGYSAFISKTLTLKWGDIHIESPTNHTVLTRLEQIWIRHNRKCLPKKSRDAVRLFYIKDNNERILVDKKYVRKLSSRKRESPGSWVKMGFPCRVFDIQGIYVLEYWAVSANKTLSTSRALHVHWARPTLKPLASQIFPCTKSFSVSIEPLKCPYVRNDYVLLREKFSEPIISQRPVRQSDTAVFFPCSSFKDYVDEYCFDYMAYSTLIKDKAKVVSECVQTHAPGKLNSLNFSLIINSRKLSIPILGCFSSKRLLSSSICLAFGLNGLKFPFGGKWTLLIKGSLVLITFFDSLILLIKFEILFTSF